jgi:type I restriction enzyme R subunit
MSKEATTFYEYIVQLGFASGSVNDADKPAFKALMETTVEILQKPLPASISGRTPINRSACAV